MLLKVNFKIKLSKNFYKLCLLLWETNYAENVFVVVLQPDESAWKITFPLYFNDINFSIDFGALNQSKICFIFIYFNGQLASKQRICSNS